MDYSTVFQLGHYAVENILSGEVTVEEKIDGSQFSFWVENGELHCRSRRAEINIQDPQKLFKLAVETVKQKADLLREGWIYRTEAVTSPRHNILKYDRIPAGGLIGFDIEVSLQKFLDYEDKAIEFSRLGIETVPLFYRGIVKDLDFLNSLLDRKSILGGNIEGIVIKNYNLFTPEKKIAVAKIVRDEFKEQHKISIKSGDRLESIIRKYGTEARWRKAVMHLKELGLITGSPSDIGRLMAEINMDTLNECREEIKEDLFKVFWKEISKGITKGFPEWYKKLLENNDE